MLKEGFGPLFPDNVWSKVTMQATDHAAASRPPAPRATKGAERPYR
jgi:hypothetical protein